MPTGGFFFFFQAEDGIRDVAVTGVQTCALPISLRLAPRPIVTAETSPRKTNCTSAFLTKISGSPNAPAAIGKREIFSSNKSIWGLARRGTRSEERRVGEEGRSRWSPYHLKKKKK